MKVSEEKIRRSRFISYLLYIQSLALFGFFSMNLLPHFIRKLGGQVNPFFIISDEVASILIASCLYLTARGIRLRRRRAWIMAASLQTLLILTSFVRSMHIFLYGHENSHIFFKAFGLTHLISEIIILTLLVRYRNIFQTIADQDSRRQAIIFFIRSSIFALLLGFLIVYFDASSFVTPVNLGQAFEIAIKGLIGVSGPAQFSSERLQERLELFLGGLGFLLVISSLVKFFKPKHLSTSLSAADAELLGSMIRNSPQSDSLSYFALRENKSVIWSKNVKAAIPYSVVAGVMITTGDPIGDQESWPSAMSAFLLEAELHGWIPAIYGCSETAGEIWVRESEFDALEIGDEAVVKIQQFSVEGPSMKNIRQTINRINRLGYTAQSSFVRDLDDVFRNRLAEVMQNWRRSGTERGFSMALGRFCDEVDPDCLITWAEHQNEIMAVLQFVPWGQSSLSLDVMRRSPESETGVNELMIQQTILFAGALHFEELSLNFASFRSIFERGKKLGAGPITRFNHKALIFLSRFFQMESLYRFNSKFQPEWIPRYVVFPGVSNLVKVGFAILKVEAFIPDVRSMLGFKRKRK